jgi:PKD domain
VIRKLLFALGAACTCMALLAGVAGAAPTWLAPVSVSAAGGDASYPQVAMDPTGDSVAVWFNLIGPNDIVQASSRQAGGSFGAPVNLSAPGQNGLGPQVAVDPSGDAIAVWYRSDGSNYRVQASFRPAGGSFGAAVTLSAPGGDGRDPQVAFDAAGNAIVVWRRSNGANLIAQAAVRPAGGGFGSPVDLSAAGGDASVPQLAVDPSGDAIAVWHRFDSVCVCNKVEATIRPAASGVWQPAVNVSANTSGNAQEPTVAIDRAGEATVVWELSGGGGETIQAAVRPTGGSFSAPADVSTPGLTAQDQRVAMDPAGDAIAVWDRYDGTNYIAQAAARPAGGSFGAPVNLSASGQDAFNEQVALDPFGNALATWQRSDGIHRRVQTARRPAGGSFGAPTDLSIASEDSLSPQLSTDGFGDAIAAWYNDNGGVDVVHAAGFDFAGPQLNGLAVPSSGTAGSPLTLGVSPLDVWSGVSTVSWQFGDGAAAAGASTQHAYTHPGLYHVTVTATDGLGNATSATRSITIRSGSSPNGGPLLTDLGISPGTFALGGRMVHRHCAARSRTNAHDRHCARAIGLTIRYRLSAASHVRLTVARLLSGRLVHGRCVAPTHANHKHRVCVRALSIGTFPGPGGAGADRLIWNGKVGGHRLTPGRYRLTATPSRSTAASTDFRITK